MTKTTSTQRMTKERSGFSLVLSLAVMAMILVMVISLTAFLTIELKSSETYLKRTLARNNAMLGARIALGQIQLWAGPDRRVSAPAEILDSNESADSSSSLNNPQWIGIWDSVKRDTNSVVSFYADFHDNHPYMDDLRSPGGSYVRPNVKGWLISQTKDNLTNPASLTPNTTPDSSWVSFLKYMDYSGAEKEIKVPYVSVYEKATNEDKKALGGYAFWVSDESLKARINLTDPYRKASPTKPEGVYRLTAPAANNIANVISGKDGLVYKNFSDDTVNERLSDVVSLGSMALLNFSSDSPEKRMKYLRQNFLDLSISSVGLFTKTTSGGFLSDMTAFLHKGSNISSDGKYNLVGISSTDPIIKHSDYEKTSPTYKVLRSWYDLRKKMTNIEDAKNASMQVIAPKQTGDTLPDGQVVDITRLSDTPITPILVDVSWAFDFVFVPGATDDDPYTIKTLFFPKVVLWNPYNVTLQGKSYGVTINMPHAVGFKITSSLGSLSPTQGINSGTFLGVGGGEPLVFNLEAIDIPPGETYVFSGPQPTTTFTDLKKDGPNTLSAHNQPGGGFGYLTGVKTIFADNKIYNPKTKSQTDDYGMSDSDANTFYGNYMGASLKLLSGTGGTATRGSILNSPTIQRFTSWGGEKSGFANSATDTWLAPGMAWAHNRAHYLMTETEFTQNRPDPPGRWRMTTRIVHVNDDEEGFKVDYGNVKTNGIPLPALRTPYMSVHNMRAVISMRNPFAYEASWFNNVFTGLHFWPRSYVALFGDDENDPIPGSNGAFQGSPFGKNGLWGASVKSYILFDLPYENVPITSLASFRHTMVSPFSWVPSFAIGSGLASIYSDPDKTLPYMMHQSKSGSYWDNIDRTSSGNWTKVLNGLQNDKSMFYDASFVLNRYIFDNFFLSTLLSQNETASKWDGITPLPNNRIKLNHAAENVQNELQSCKSNLDGMYHRVSSILVNEGAFNVNSTNVEAWKAYLSSILGAPRPLSGKGGSQTTFKDRAEFSKLTAPKNGVGLVSNLISDTMWNGHRALNAEEIEKLAKAIVREVKLRGPFMSLSDFVNRRLTGRGTSGAAMLSTSFDEIALMGALDSAIRNAGLNNFLYRSQPGASALSDPSDKNANDPLLEDHMNTYIQAYPDWRSAAAPGDLTQGDILQAMAPSMTVRSDTFTIRAYGDYKNPVTNQVESSAYLELTVQRMPSFVDPHNDALEPVSLEAGPKTDARMENPNLTQANKYLGRRFQIVGVNWITKDEI